MSFFGLTYDDRRCVIGCVKGILPDMPNGPKAPEVALKIHKVYTLTQKYGKSVFINSDDDDNEDDDDKDQGFPIDMNCDQTYDEDQFPNDDLNHTYRAFCPKMCFDSVATSTCVGDSSFMYSTTICAAARYQGIFIRDKDAYFNIKNMN